MTGPGLVLAVGLFLVLAVVLPMISVVWQDDTATTLNVVLALVITTWSSAMIAAICFRGAGAIVRLAFYVFLYVFMGLPVLAQVVTGQFPVTLPTTGAYTDGLITRALVVVLVSVLAFEVGTVAVRAWGARAPHRQPGRGPAPNPGLGWVLSEGRVTALGVLALIATVVLVARTGLAPYFDSRQALSGSVNGTGGLVKAIAATGKAQNTIFKYAAQVPALFALFGQLYLRHHRRWHPRSDLLALLGGAVLVPLVVANLVINNPISNSRFWFSIVAIALLSVYLPMSRAAGIRWAAVLTLVTLLFAFTSLDAFRRSTTVVDRSNGFRSDLVNSATYSAFTMEMVALRWLRVNPHTDGRQLLGTVLIFVPRAQWPGKPVDTGNLVLPYANPAAPLWAEGEVDGGPGLMAAYFLALGAGAAALDRRMRAGRVGTVEHAVVPIVAGLLIFVLRGSLQAAAAPTYAMAVCTLFIARRAPVAAVATVPAGSAAPDVAVATVPASTTPPVPRAALAAGRRP